MSAPCVIEVAVNGTTPKSVNPHVPRTPAEITADALACVEAGATIVHNHNTSRWSSPTACTRPSRTSPRVALAFRAAGALPRGAIVKLYFGGGIPFGLPPTRAGLDAYLAMLDGPACRGRSPCSAAT